MKVFVILKASTAEYWGDGKWTRETKGIKMFANRSRAERMMERLLDKGLSVTEAECHGVELPGGAVEVVCKPVGGRDESASRDD